MANIMALIYGPCGPPLMLPARARRKPPNAVRTTSQSSSYYTKEIRGAPEGVVNIKFEQIRTSPLRCHQWARQHQLVAECAHGDSLKRRKRLGDSLSAPLLAPLARRCAANKQLALLCQV